MSDPQITPTVEKMVTTLRNAIKMGAYGRPGVGRIPTTSELQREFGVSRSTIYTVIQLLRSEGLVYQRGKYLIVSEQFEIEGITENFERFLRNHDHGVDIENIIVPSIEPMPPNVAMLFGIEYGLHVVHRERKQGADGIGLRIAENWYPAILAARFLEEMRQDERMDVVGAIKKTHGVYIVESLDEVVARIPTSQEAKILGISRTEPVVEIRRSNFAQDGSPVMWNKIIHVAPFFKFTYRYPVDHWKK